MHTYTHGEADWPDSTALAGRFVRAACWYFLAMAVLWRLGVESIYGHPTPFYAIYLPNFESPIAPFLCFLPLLAALWAVRRHVPFIALLGALAAALFLAYSQSGEAAFSPDTLLAGAAQLRYYAPALALLAIAGIGLPIALRHSGLPHAAPSARWVTWFLVALLAYTFLLACATAAMRGGLDGIAQAYAPGRQHLEFTGDIGVTSSFQELFRRYTTLQPHLSLHGRVHPPGPIILLWTFSLFIGQDPLALALATAFFGSLAVLPFYAWAREVLGPRAAIIACLCYPLVPSILLFTATSADILFMPFTLTTLWLFDRAIRRNSIPAALAAGLGYGLLGLLKYSLLSIGAYFAFTGLWMLADPTTRRNVFQTAALMLAAALAVHVAVRMWSGFDLFESFRIAKTYVDHDRFYEQTLAPRAGFWWWKLLNPACWFYFAGLPISLLFLSRLWRPAATPALRARFLVILLTVIALSLLYIGSGEGERSALFLFPFLILPAAHRLHDQCEQQQTFAPLAITLAFLATQCALTETLFYTYW